MGDKRSLYLQKSDVKYEIIESILNSHLDWYFSFFIFE